MSKVDAFTDRIYSDVEKDYGKGIIIDGLSATKDKPQIISWTPSIDIIAGPIEEGSWVGITGNPKYGKTSLALTFAAQAQKPENGSRPVYYDKVEGRLSLHHLQGIEGLDLSKGKFNIIQSTKDRILTTQDRLTILGNIIRNVPKAVVIIDSISCYCDEKEHNEGVETETRGGGAKLFSRFLRTMNQVVPVNNTIVLGITHLICNTGGGMGPKYFERAARMWSYMKDYDLKCVTKTPWKVGDKQIGLIVKWVCNTSKTLSPGSTIDGYLRFGKGFERLYELMSLGMACGVIKKAGAWYNLPFVKDNPKFQGGENLYNALLGRKEWQEELEKQVMAMAAGLAGSSGDE